MDRLSVLNAQLVLAQNQVDNLKAMIAQEQALQATLAEQAQG